MARLLSSRRRHDSSRRGKTLPILSLWQSRIPSNKSCQERCLLLGLTLAVSDRASMAQPMASVMGKYKKDVLSALKNFIEHFRRRMQMRTHTPDPRGLAGALAILTVVYGTCLNALLQAQEVRYVYDTKGQLVGVIDVDGSAATYNVDENGHLMGISRSYLKASAT